MMHYCRELMRTYLDFRNTMTRQSFAFVSIPPIGTDEPCNLPGQYGVGSMGKVQFQSSVVTWIERFVQNVLVPGSRVLQCLHPYSLHDGGPVKGVMALYVPKRRSSAMSVNGVPVNPPSDDPSCGLVFIPARGYPGEKGDGWCILFDLAINDYDLDCVTRLQCLLQGLCPNSMEQLALARERNRLDLQQASRFQMALGCPSATRHPRPMALPKAIFLVAACARIPLGKRPRGSEPPSPPSDMGHKGEQSGECSSATKQPNSPVHLTPKRVLLDEERTSRSPPDQVPKPPIEAFPLLQEKSSIAPSTFSFDLDEPMHTGTEGDKTPAIPTTVPPPTQPPSRDLISRERTFATSTTHCIGLPSTAKTPISSTVQDDAYIEVSPPPRTPSGIPVDETAWNESSSRLGSCGVLLEQDDAYTQVSSPPPVTSGILVDENPWSESSSRLQTSSGFFVLAEGYADVSPPLSTPSDIPVDETPWNEASSRLGASSSPFVLEVSSPSRRPLRIPWNGGREKPLESFDAFALDDTSAVVSPFVSTLADVPDKAPREECPLTPQISIIHTSSPVAMTPLPLIPKDVATQGQGSSSLPELCDSSSCPFDSNDGHQLTRSCHLETVPLSSHLALEPSVSQSPAAILNNEMTVSPLKGLQQGHTPAPNSSPTSPHEEYEINEKVEQDSIFLLEDGSRTPLPINVNTTCPLEFASPQHASSPSQPPPLQTPPQTQQGITSTRYATKRWYEYQYDIHGVSAYEKRQLFIDEVNPVKLAYAFPGVDPASMSNSFPFVVSLIKVESAGRELFEVFGASRPREAVELVLRLHTSTTNTKTNDVYVAMTGRTRRVDVSLDITLDDKIETEEVILKRRPIATIAKEAVHAWRPGGDPYCVRRDDTRIRREPMTGLGIPYRRKGHQPPVDCEEDSQHYTRLVAQPKVLVIPTALRNILKRNIGHLKSTALSHSPREGDFFPRCITSSGDWLADHHLEIGTAAVQFIKENKRSLNHPFPLHCKLQSSCISQIERKSDSTMTLQSFLIYYLRLMKLISQSGTILGDAIFYKHQNQSTQDFILDVVFGRADTLARLFKETENVRECLWVFRKAL